MSFLLFLRAVRLASYVKFSFLVSQSIRYAYSFQAELEFHSHSALSQSSRRNSPRLFPHFRGGSGVLACCDTS